jgi:hypothetical protein
MNAPRTSLFSPLQQVFDSFWSVPLTTWQRLFTPQPVFNDSHGRQLGALLDMVCLLRTRLLDVSQLSAEQRAVVDEVDRLQAESALAAAGARGEPGSVSAEQVLSVLTALRAKDPGAYAALRARILELGD